MPTRNFRELLEAMPADRQRRIEKRFQKSLEAMPLDQLRKAQEMTQLQLAEILGVNQGEVSKIEHRSDICVSTLAEYIEAMGGRLEIRAVFKDREVRITQFEEFASDFGDMPVMRPVEADPGSTPVPGMAFHAFRLWRRANVNLTFCCSPDPRTRQIRTSI